MTAIMPKTGPMMGAPAGNALPPYLQARKPVPMGPSQTAPVITPKSSVVPGEAVGQSASAIAPAGTQKALTAPPTAPAPQGLQPSAATSPEANISLAHTTYNPNLAPAPTPPQAGGNNLTDVYNFFKSDLENQTKQALAGTRADASARGVFYGTPLTGSEADINTQYLRGLGQLQAGMFGNQQQLALAGLGLGSNLNAMGALTAPQAPGIDQNLFTSLGQLFANSPQNPANNPASGNTPVISPRNGPVGKVGK